MKAADVAGCSLIVQCGDLGYWPHRWPEYLHLLDEQMAAFDSQRAEVGLPPLQLVWVDGNHENFDVLYEKKDSFEKTPRGFWRTSERTNYAPRGHRWEWDGVSFLALGGGNSIDKALRHPHTSWWWQELITPRNVRDAVEGGPVDIMVTHDMPEGVPSGPTLFIKSQPEDDNNRRNVRAVVDAVHPKWLFHGHYHHRYNSLLGDTKIVGLGCDSMFEKNWTVFDLAQMKGLITGTEDNV